MVVTLTLESPEARTAVEAARQTGDLLLLVPRLENRYASVGVVATIEDSGRLQNGMEALVIRALHRAVIGTGVAGTGDATWVQVTEADEQNADSSRAREDVQENLNKTQREFILRQQMEAIRKELGEGEDGQSVVEEYRNKIAEAGMPEEVRKQADNELGRLERTSEQSPEYGWIRTYL